MRSPALALSIAGLATAALTLSIKGVMTESALVLDIAGAKSDLAWLLRRQGFTASIEDRLGDQDIVRGARGSCRLALRPEQSDEYVAGFAKQTPGLKRRGWIYLGKEMAAFPGFTASADNYWRRLSARLGLPVRERWPLMVAHNGRCSLSSLDLGDQGIALILAP